MRKTTGPCSNCSRSLVNPAGMGIVVLVTLLVTSTGGLSAQNFESPTTLRASEVLPDDMQRGRRFEVQEQVKNDGFMNYYVVDSDFGKFEAYSTPALAKLIQEIAALDQLDEVSKSDVFLDSVKRSATSQGEAIKDFADKPVQTVKGVPDGLKRSFRKYKRDAEEGYETAKEVSGDVIDSVSGKEETDEGGEDASSEGGDSSDLVGKSTEAAEAYAKKWFGVSAAERGWHQKLGTDPYTTNQALRKRIKELSRVSGATGMGMRFVPIPRIPGARELAQLNSMVWSVDPRELREQNIKQLVEAGVDEELVEGFINNPWFSPTGQTLILTALLQMEGVEGRRALLEVASAAASASEAQFDLGNIVILSTYHRSVKPVDHLLPGKVTAAVTKDGDLLKIVSVDHAFWQKDLAGAATTFMEEVADHPATTRELWLRGTASPRFRTEVENRGWTVHETVELDPKAGKDEQR